MLINLFGPEGSRQFSPVPSSAPEPSIPVQESSLDPKTLVAVIESMTVSRWYNLDEILIQLSRIHGITVSPNAIAVAATEAKIETRGAGRDLEMRIHDEDACAVHRKSAFACARELQPRLTRTGIGAEMLWGYVKKTFSVRSRSEMTAPQWATLSAELHAARRDPRLFQYFVNSIRRSA